MEFVEQQQSNNTLNSVPLIESAEELDKLLAGGQEDPAGKSPEEIAAEKVAADAKAAATTKQQAPAKQAATSPFNQQSTADDIADDDDDTKDKSTDEPKNMLAYLNGKHKLGLNEEAIQGELNPVEEREAVSEILERMTVGVNQALENYRYIDALMEDPEVKTVLEAKAAGKSLKDIIGDYVKTTDGMSNDELVKADLVSKYKGVKPEVIDKMVDGYKKSGDFDAIAQAVREQKKAEDDDAARVAADRAKLTEVQQAQRYEQERNEFKGFLGTIKNVYGVPVDDETKAELHEFITKRDQATGMTGLDTMLQSNEGLLLAALGMKKLSSLVSTKASVLANRKNSALVNKIFDSPERLQSGSNRGAEDEMDMALVNQF